MGTVRIPLGPHSADQLFEGMPSRIKGRAKVGFSVLSRLSEESMSVLIQELGHGVEIFQRNTEELDKRLKLSSSEIGPLLSAMSIVVGATSMQLDSRGFAEAAVRAGALDEHDVAAFLRLLEGLQPVNLQIRKSVKRERLVGEVLPSYDDLGFTVDVRLSFEKKEVDLAVPVLIAHLTTDDDDTHVWFQMSQQQLEDLIGTLERAKAQLEAAERWGRR